jgi:hypothetical protein
MQQLELDLADGVSKAHLSDIDRYPIGAILGGIAIYQPLAHVTRSAENLRVD